MWFTNPGRDAVWAILSRILTPYVSNLDLSQFEAGLWAGQFSVNNLRLKKSALDKFRLPIDVIEGMNVFAQFTYLYLGLNPVLL
jgi:vacuolar protein sorting-associated protein 13A/C